MTEKAVWQSERTKRLEDILDSNQIVVSWL